MANVRDSDTSLWLHNKLGISNDSWTGGSICSQLNAEVLRNIKACFPDLQTQVKLKLLLSIFHIPRRNVEEWRHELDDILVVAVNDSEAWVSMLAETMRTLPSTGSLNLEIRHNDDNQRIFSDLVNDLRKLVRKQNDGGMLPLECHYLNKNALVTVVGQQPQPVKHFSLKRKPKSAALRAELLSKSADAVSHLKKSAAPTVPVRSRGMPRKMTDTTPLKGIPSRVPTGGFKSPVVSNQNNQRVSLGRTPVNRKDGGIKLIDINEQPLGYAQAKKRKRLQETEDARKASETAASQQATNAVSTPGAAASSANAAPGTPATQVTPDYAAGLAPINPSTPAQSSSATVLTAANPAGNPQTPVAAGETVIILNPSTPLPSTAATAAASTTTVTQPRVIAVNTIAVAAPSQAAAAAAAATSSQPISTTATIVTPASASAQASTSAQTTSAAPATAPAASQPAPPRERRQLSLTREQMVEAQEMFRTANKVTRPEKALILGFMAGSR
ncbi:Negative elongation factor A, partial [Frankliniella fusca]